MIWLEFSWPGDPGPGGGDLGRLWVKRGHAEAVPRIGEFIRADWDGWEAPDTEGNASARRVERVSWEWTGGDLLIAVELGPIEIE